MSAPLSEIAELIRATEAELEHADRAVAAQGATVSMRLMTESLRSRRGELERRFAAATEAQELDVCNYRLIADVTGRYPVGAVAQALSDFQQFVSVLYEAITTNAPRQKAHVSAATTARTTLDFAYSFAGSLGVAMTMPRERVLIGDSHLDVAVDTLFALAKAESSEVVAAFSRRFGTAPVRIAHRWAKAHVSAGMSVDVEWKREAHVKNRILVQVAELQRLTEFIEAVGDTVIDQFEVYGKLIAGNISSGSFILEVDEKTQIRGHRHATFTLPAGTDMSLGVYYHARIERHTQFIYASQQEVETHYLLSLGKGPFGDDRQARIE